MGLVNPWVGSKLFEVAWVKLVHQHSRVLKMITLSQPRKHALNLLLTCGMDPTGKTIAKTLYFSQRLLDECYASLPVQHNLKEISVQLVAQSQMLDQVCLHGKLKNWNYLDGAVELP
ncbi:hypothetical protein HELRODRAFT_182697 [Helobdella robusta]|uniref:Uncharacterized protein n=1 Tax=Helobdella robusta TaxID=6412 RepID=T1FIL3_HELRO|nr:hypothetical protein HELRODRAFT_182697 [Helobdella robusta]ESN90200.1 hypothetical protein HELRODRAFT_182697 [Helobdella robusta]